MSSGKFVGRVALVTGAGAGIGRAVAACLSGHGARVAVLDINGGAATRTAESCQDVALAVEADVSDPESLRMGHDRVRAELGDVDLLVNNVAIAESSPLVVSDDSHWSRMLATNFLSVVRASRLVLPAMRERRRGSIVNISSVHARRGYADWAAYAAAKGALLAFTRQQAVEQAPYGIRINAVTPGATMTDLQRRRMSASGDPDEFVMRMAASCPMGRFGEPAEVAAVVAFVLSDDASFMTGAEIVSDGGNSAFGI